MTVRDIRNNLDAAHSLEPAVRPTGTYNGAGVDLAGFSAAMLLVYFGAWTNGVHTPGLDHSDDNVNFAAVPAAELDGSLAAVNAAGGANSQQRVGYRGGKRYLRATLAVTSGATGAASTATIIRGLPANAPV